MANATTKIEKKTVTETVDETVIVLTLTKVEAAALRALVGDIIGDSRTTYNRDYLAIYKALKSAGALEYYSSRFFSVGTYGDIIAKPIALGDK